MAISELGSFYGALFRAWHSCLLLFRDRRCPQEEARKSQCHLHAPKLEGLVLERVMDFLDSDQLCSEADDLSPEGRGSPEWIYCVLALCNLEDDPDSDDWLRSELKAVAKEGSWHKSKGGSLTGVLKVVQNEVAQAVRETAVRQHLPPMFSPFDCEHLCTLPLSRRCDLAAAVVGADN